MLSDNRNIIVENAQKESDKSDLKQHADKMIRGFENFNKSSSNRAIWELVQNACDLTNNCEIIIDYTNKGFSFTHNGKPFTTNSLISLIKQVSGKYGENTDIPEVGKYGTGFLTTHSFGRKFEIDSVLEAGEIHLKIDSFLIDRSPREWEQLSENIRIQKQQVYDLIKYGEIISDSNKKTTFKFLPQSVQEHDYISKSSKDLEEYIPIVLTINDRLKKVRIITDTSTINFERTSREPVTNENNIKLFKTKILKNGEEKVLYSILEEDDDIEIILPINEKLELFEFSESIARLFLYYPLIGTENFGINFIINCNKFLPTEPRDAIHLNSNKDQVEDQEIENKRIIEKASDLIFFFLENNELIVENPLLYARINFKRNSENQLLNEYFNILQNKWTENFLLLPLVESEKGFKTVQESCFFDAEILLNSEYFEEIYKLSSSFKDNLPIKLKAESWSQLVSEWSNEKLSFIAHKDIVSFISTKHLNELDSETLIRYYQCIIEKQKWTFFSEYTLLPNLEGDLCLISPLLIPKNIDDVLVEIGKVIIPKSIEKLIHKDFYFDFQLEEYNRKDFSNSVKIVLDERQMTDSICIKNTNIEDYDQIILNDNKRIDLVFFTHLVKYCKLSTNINSNSKPNLLLKILCKYYDFDESLIFLENIEEQEKNLDVSSARKLLVQVFFNLIQYHNPEWVKNNISLLLDIANCNEDSLKDVFSKSKIYPSKINELKLLGNLKKDFTTDEMKLLYTNIMKHEIKNDMICSEFDNHVLENKHIIDNDLAKAIESKLFDTDIKNINEHPFKDYILKIISKLKDENYAELFPRLDREKAALMLEVVTDDSTKDYIFSIVSLKSSQLKKLGALVKESNFEEILTIANSFIQQKKEEEAQFNHKYEIGTDIERLIREKLSNELKGRISFDKENNIEALDIQGGQDIILLLDNKPIYYVEVKSKWDSSYLVTMSKLQLERAVEKKECYSLCIIDISCYTGNSDKYKLTIDEVIPLTRFVSDIGNNIKPLIEGNLIAEKKQNELIYLTDYKGIVPQEIIKKGVDFEAFVEMLLVTIKQKANSI